MIGDVETRSLQADAGANLPGESRVLLGGIVAEEQNGLRAGKVAEGGFDFAVERGGKGGVVGGAVVVDVVGGEDGAGELLEEIRFLVGGPIRSDDADGRAAFGVANLAEALAGEVHGLVPADGFELAAGFAH